MTPYLQRLRKLHEAATEGVFVPGKLPTKFSMDDLALFCFLRNSAPAIIKLVEQSQKMLDASDRFVADTGLKHGDPITDAAEELRKALAALDAEGK